MSFADLKIVYATGVILIVLAVAFALDFTRRRRLMERIGHAPQLLRMTASASPVRRGVKAVLTVLGVTLVMLAVARPQTEGEKTWRQRGIDIVLAMDFSKSMLALDVYPSRIERAKLDVDEMVDKFVSDRIGLVAFGGESIHYPLTSDHEALKILYHGIDPRDLPPGTDIAEAVRTSRCLLEGAGTADPDCAESRGHGGDPLPSEAQAGKLDAPDLGDRGRAIVLITDGEETEGHAQAEIEHAHQLGIEVYIIAIGTKEGARIPEYDAEGHITGWKLGPDKSSYYTTHVDEEAMKELAKAGGGEDHYFHVDSRRVGVESLVKALGKLKEGNLEERTESIPKEAYAWILFPAFMALLVEACLSERRRERRKQGGCAHEPQSRGCDDGVAVASAGRRLGSAISQEPGRGRGERGVCRGQVGRGDRPLPGGDEGDPRRARRPLRPRRGAPVERSGCRRGPGSQDPPRRGGQGARRGDRCARCQAARRRALQPGQSELQPGGIRPRGRRVQEGAQARSRGRERAPQSGDGLATGPAKAAEAAKRRRQEATAATRSAAAGSAEAR